MLPEKNIYIGIHNYQNCYYYGIKIMVIGSHAVQTCDMCYMTHIIGLGYRRNNIFDD